MQKLVSGLSGSELDYWVGMAERIILMPSETGWKYITFSIKSYDWSPSTKPEQAYPIIERDKIGFRFNERIGCWFASIPKYPATCCEGETLLIAAMRCKVASFYGEYVNDQQSNNQ